MVLNEDNLKRRNNNCVGSKLCNDSPGNIKASINIFNRIQFTIRLTTSSCFKVFLSVLRQCCFCFVLCHAKRKIKIREKVRQSKISYWVKTSMIFQNTMDLKIFFFNDLINVS